MCQSLFIVIIISRHYAALSMNGPSIEPNRYRKWCPTATHAVLALSKHEVCQPGFAAVAVFVCQSLTLSGSESARENFCCCQFTKEQPLYGQLECCALTPLIITELLFTTDMTRTNDALI